jgi:hypothetical protein
MSHARFTAIAALALLLAGCKALRRPLVIDTEPPGALVRINGVDSGFATPCVLDLDDQSVETVELELAGYRTERHELRDGEWTRALLWPEMSAGTHTWRFPLFLSFEHAIRPFETSNGATPPRIHARLVREQTE